MKQPKPYAFGSERWWRNARMAGLAFGHKPNDFDWYSHKGGRAHWYAYWQHARLNRSLRYRLSKQKRPLLHCPYFDCTPRIVGEGTPILYKKARHGYPGIKGRLGRAQAEEDHEVWAFRYHLMLETLKHMGKPYDAELIRRFRIKVMKEENP